MAVSWDDGVAKGGDVGKILVNDSFIMGFFVVGFLMFFFVVVFIVFIMVFGWLFLVFWLVLYPNPSKKLDFFFMLFLLLRDSMCFLGRLR